MDIYPHLSHTVRLFPKRYLRLVAVASCELPHGLSPRRFHPNLHQLSSPCFPSPSSHLVVAIETDFNRQWEEARSAEDESKSFPGLAKILLSKEGQKFILTLEPIVH